MQKPENTTLINICIVPNSQVGATCVSLSQSLESESTLFVLGGDKFAHMTVYMARFADSEVEKVIHGVESVMESVEEFYCEKTGFFLTEGNYLEVSYRRSPELMQLHESLISQIAQYRINPGKPFEEGYFAPYTSEQKQNAIDTGYDLARKLYRPHITLTRYKSGDAPKVLPELPEAELSFDLNKVCIYKADDNGAVFELIKEFEV